MHITFLIGNGFDINLGLHTRYSEFYPYFIEHAADDNMIKQWLDADDLLWADLEEKLGEKLREVKVEEKEKFYIDKAQMDGLLLEYLGQEQGKVHIQGNARMAAEEFARSLKEFYADLSENDKTAIHTTCTKHENEKFEFHFIMFNYTNTLDQFVQVYSAWKPSMTTFSDDGTRREHLMGKVLHVHGTIEEEMILGVNDREQIKNSFLKNDAEFQDIFIKERMNDNIGQNKTEKAKKMIQESRIICIFGMSLGSTDKMWWEEICSWLQLSEDNKLIIYYKDGTKNKLPINIIRNSRELKNRIMEYVQNAEDADKIRNQIFVAYNANIFNFKELDILKSS